MGRAHAAARCFAAMLFATLATSCTQEAPVARTVYVTEYGLGPDKWATAWLLTRHLDQRARLEVFQRGQPVSEGVLFDAPSAPIRRVGNRSAFEVAQAQLGRKEPTLDALAQIVHEIEINFWSAGGPAQARFVEEAFRSLQHRYGRDAVTPQCYVAFFERVYRVLQDEKTPISAERLQMSCEDLTQLGDERSELVPEVPVVDVLGAAAAGRRVVFVDVRESDEYEEGHIPGALNIPIRDVGPALKERLSGA
ncbi:MAG: chromate resistance protein ChrB domain-containing protein, partial [Steroidobacteraceae bacterium]